MVKNLYHAQNAGSGPFFQSKSSVLVERYFMKDLADLIWKDYLNAKGDIGALDFDPLYGSQDPQISDFKILESREADSAKVQAGNKVLVEVTFKDAGKKRRIAFDFEKDQDGAWKIFDIRYPDKSSLRDVFAR